MGNKIKLESDQGDTHCWTFSCLFFAHSSYPLPHNSSLSSYFDILTQSRTSRDEQKVAKEMGRGEAPKDGPGRKVRAAAGFISSKGGAAERGCIIVPKQAEGVLSTCKGMRKAGLSSKKS